MDRSSVPREASYWVGNEDGSIICMLCPHNCRIGEGSTGVCRTRRNIHGKLHSLNYGLISSIALDPIEKKPLYHFHPGSKILSVGTFGCNFKCSFCQNWTIAQAEPETMSVSPQELVYKALELREQGNIGIAFTYNEPSVWFEFILDTARHAKEAQLKNVMVTNGFISKDPLMELLDYIDAMNIDVKGFTDDFYKKVCKGSLEDVRRTVETAVEKCHVEITTLLVPGLNDSIEEIGQLARWLASLNKDIPLHLTRYFPNFEMMDRPPTPRETLEKARLEAIKYLNHVHLGNV